MLEQAAGPEIANRRSAPAQPVRIALVVHTFEIGGIERHVARLASRLDRQRFQPLVICLDRNGAAAKWIEMDDVPIIELNKRAGNDPQVVFRLARTLRETGAQIVHSHNWGTLLETALARRWAGTLAHVHAERGTVLGDVKPRGFRARLRALAMGWALRRASAVVSNARSVAERAAAHSGYPLERIRVIPNGLDAPAETAPQDARELRRRLGIPEEVLVAGSVGRLAPVKNFASAIEALSRPEGSANPVHLLLVGDGPERKKLEELAKTPAVAGRLHFAGWQEDVGPLLAAMDIYLNCSVSEGMSQSLVEAMSLGLPIVATDVGDNAVLVGGDDACGLVVARLDDAALAAGLARLAASVDLRRELGRNSLVRFSERYRTDRMISCYESLYDELCLSVSRN